MNVHPRIWFFKISNCIESTETQISCHASKNTVHQLNVNPRMYLSWILFQSLLLLSKQSQRYEQWPIRRTWGTIWQRSSSSLFCRRPLWAVPAWAGISILWCCPSSISSADNGVAHSPTCPEGWFWRGCRGVWHVRTMQVSVSWQLPEEVRVDPQGSWSCSTPSRWSCDPSRRYGEVSSRTWFRKPGSFFFFSRVSKQDPCLTAVEEDGGDKKLLQQEGS